MTENIEDFLERYEREIMNHSMIIEDMSAMRSLFFSDCNDSALKKIKAAHEAGDTAKAKELYKVQKKNANKGMAQAQYVVSECCFNGWGTKQDDKKAFAWYKRSAYHGDVRAQCGLGYYYHYYYNNHFYHGCDRRRCFVQAFVWYKKAAEQGNSWAQSKLGRFYLSFGPRYRVHARYWYEKSGAPEPFVMGEPCFDDWRPSKNFKKTFAGYKKSANQGDPYAQNSLGVCYANGWGTRQDYRQAFEWYKKAAEQGNSWAQHNLGRCYAKGWGTAVNATQAQYWYKKSGLK